MGNSKLIQENSEATHLKRNPLHTARRDPLHYAESGHRPITSPNLSTKCGLNLALKNIHPLYKQICMHTPHYVDTLSFLFYRPILFPPSFNCQNLEFLFPYQLQNPIVFLQLTLNPLKIDLSERN